LDGPSAPLFDEVVLNYISDCIWTFKNKKYNTFFHGHLAYRLHSFRHLTK
jgi:putative flippase GtrA